MVQPIGCDVAGESIIPGRSDQTNAGAVAATLLNNYSDFAAGVHGSQTDTAS